MTNIYEITFRAADGRELTEFAWIPTADVRKDLIDRAKRYGLEIIIK